MRAGDRTPNRLAGSRSVYLQQHARNPVDWHPWGEEAIAIARARNLPLFVSIGYSTCYWCHVMERESFEDAATAAVLNRVCVPVKVDREERPDIDEVMMTACQVFTQLTEGRASGGWPLNVLLDPTTLQPFFCGTYFPPHPAHGRPSLKQLLAAVEAAWRKDPAGLRAQAQQIAAHVSAQLTGVEIHAGADAPDEAALGTDATVQQVVDALMRAYDPTDGGFGGAPKFPTPSYLSFLLAARGHVPSIERAVRHTLDRMAVGGIFDHVGGGFHRYAVDAQWTVPHFEKMLYDNAQLATLYASAAERWGDAFDAHVARRTLDYVLREMTGSDGQFWSAQDAEVGAREGANYVWTEGELREALAAGGLAAADIARAVRAYGVDRGPNFQDPHDSMAAPCSVLRLEGRPDAVAAAHGMAPDEFASMLGRVNAALLARRAARAQPTTDDKTIAAWTGMAIEALATAGRALREPRYTAAANRAADFVLARMRDEHGDLLRIWRGGEAAGAAFLEDSACIANGLIALDRRGEALSIVRAAHARFADARTGAWFDVASGQNELWVRSRNLDDGAVPSGTSGMLRALIALAETDAACLRWACELVASVEAAVREQPVSASALVLGAWRLRTMTAGRKPSAASPVLLDLAWIPGTASAELRMRIADAHHVLAEGALRIEAAPGLPALTVTPLDAPGAQGWTGTARFTIALASVPDSAPSVVVHWQACTDRECWPPRTTTVNAHA